MKVSYSKDFEKSVRRLSGKTLNSVRETIRQVKDAPTLSAIADCKKLAGFENVYRIRIGSLRAFFLFHLEIVEDTIFFKYLVPRGQAYDKRIVANLHRDDR